MVKRNAIATKLTKRCTQTQKRAFDVAVSCKSITDSAVMEEAFMTEFSKCFTLEEQVFVKLSYSSFKSFYFIF